MVLKLYKKNSHLKEVLKIMSDIHNDFDDININEDVKDQIEEDFYILTAGEFLEKYTGVIKDVVTITTTVFEYV